MCLFGQPSAPVAPQAAAPVAPGIGTTEANSPVLGISVGDRRGGDPNAPYGAQYIQGLGWVSSDGTVLGPGGSGGPASPGGFPAQASDQASPAAAPAPSQGPVGGSPFSSSLKERYGSPRNPGQGRTFQKSPFSGGGTPDDKLRARAANLGRGSGGGRSTNPKPKYDQGFGFG